MFQAERNNTKADRIVTVQGRGNACMRVNLQKRAGLPAGNPARVRILFPKAWQVDAQEDIYEQSEHE
jgi:hypothetical protein